MSLVAGGFGVAYTLPMVINDAQLRAQMNNVEQVACYWFCGPWYTWLVTWLVALFTIVYAVGLVVRWSNHDE